MNIAQKSLVIIVFVFLFGLAPAALAHQPRIVEEGKGVIEVKNPEASQAFYAILSGQAPIYEINSDKTFTLYVNLLAPKIKNASTSEDISALVYQKAETGNKLLEILAGPKAQWIEFHEPFANDDYFKGPEFKRQVSAGDYFVKIISPCYPGLPAGANFEQSPSCAPEKYVLAIGEKEEFSLGEIINTIRVLPAEKRFFNKPPSSAYYNLTGLFMLGALIIILIIIFLAVIIFKRRRKRA